jgi:DME family drug/metabolite transporter
VVLVVGERPAMPTLAGGFLLLCGVAYRYWPPRLAQRAVVREPG